MLHKMGERMDGKEREREGARVPEMARINDKFRLRKAFVRLGLDRIQ
jgi:hypothetical protein